MAKFAITIFEPAEIILNHLDQLRKDLKRQNFVAAFFRGSGETGKRFNRFGGFEICEHRLKKVVRFKSGSDSGLALRDVREKSTQKSIRVPFDFACELGDFPARKGYDAFHIALLNLEIGAEKTGQRIKGLLEGPRVLGVVRVEHAEPAHEHGRGDGSRADGGHERGPGQRAEDGFDARGAASEAGDAALCRAGVRLPLEMLGHCSLSQKWELHSKNGNMLFLVCLANVREFVAYIGKWRWISTHRFSQVRFVEDTSVSPITPLDTAPGAVPAGSPILLGIDTAQATRERAPSAISPTSGSATHRRRTSPPD
jgi:hypothetical protein